MPVSVLALALVHRIVASFFFPSLLSVTARAFSFPSWASVLRARAVPACASWSTHAPTSFFFCCLRLRVSVSFNRCDVATLVCLPVFLHGTVCAVAENCSANAIVRAGRHHHVRTAALGLEDGSDNRTRKDKVRNAAAFTWQDDRTAALHTPRLDMNETKPHRGNDSNAAAPHRWVSPSLHRFPSCSPHSLRARRGRPRCVIVESSYTCPSLVSLLLLVICRTATPLAIPLPLPLLLLPTTTPVYFSSCLFSTK